MQSIIRPLTVVAGLVALASCGGDSTSATGKLAVQMTDAPFPFSQVSMVVDILGLLTCGLVGYLAWDAYRDLR